VADVVVVGAGVVGLTTAVRLQWGGARVVVLTADEPAATVSRIAAAVWYPTHTTGDPRTFEWARMAFDELTDQADRGTPGVVMRPTRMLLRAPAGRPWWAAAVADFEEAPAPTGYAGEWRFTVPSAEMGPYLDWLAGQVVANGGEIRRQSLDHLADAGAVAPIVVNATGLAARRLADDSTVYPARGRIVLVANPGLHVSVRDEDNPAGVTYVHPRSTDVVLGGTFEEHAWDTTVDDEVSAAIVRRCVALVPELADAPVLARLAGLRPARSAGARVEEDPDGLPGGQRLIHNYGHGGAGVTLSWGCAEEVARLCA
jgi:D-amino-acid oxidase